MAGITPLILVGETEVKVAETPPIFTVVPASVPKPLPPIVKVGEPSALALHGKIS